MGCGCNKSKKGATTAVDPKKGFVPEVSKTIQIDKVHPAGTKKVGGSYTEKLTEENLQERLTPTPAVKEPSLLKKALSLGEAVVNHVADGLTKTTKEELALRLSICESCHHRNGSSCGLCGCDISTKSGWRSSTCPDDRWPIFDIKEK